MLFQYPTFAACKYRLWRLRRLIVVSTLPPLLAFSIASFTGLNTLGSTMPGFVFGAAVLALLVIGHLVLFPNSPEENFAISTILTLFALLSPFFASSILGWLLFIVVAILIFFILPGKIMSWLGQTKLRSGTLKSRIKTRANAAAAREWFPLRPDQKRGHYRCGSVNADRQFPVWYEAPIAGLLYGLDMDEPEETEDDPDTIAPLSEYVNEQHSPEYEDQDDPEPSFWAEIQIDEPTHQKTVVIAEDTDGEWTEDVTVEHHFKPLKSGCVITEIESINTIPGGHKFMMWLNDFHRDGLIFHRELLEDKPPLSLRAAHRWSMMTLLGRWFLMRRIRKNRAS